MCSYGSFWLSYGYTRTMEQGPDCTGSCPCLPPLCTLKQDISQVGTGPSQGILYGRFPKV